MDSTGSGATEGLDRKIRALQDDMLKQLREVLELPPTEDMVPLVDMFTSEAGGVVRELQEKVEVCMQNQQFDLVEKIVSLTSEYEDLQARVERWKRDAGAGGPSVAEGGGRPPGASPVPATSQGSSGSFPQPGASPAAAVSGGSVGSGSRAPAPSPALGSPAASPAGSAAPGGPAASPAAAFPAAASPTAAAPAAAGQGAPGGGYAAAAGVGLRAADFGEAQVPPGGAGAQQEAGAARGAGPAADAFLEEEAARREREEEEEQRFGRFDMPDDRLPAQSELGGLPEFSSARSSRSTGSSAGGRFTPLSTAAQGFPEQPPFGADQDVALGRIGENPRAQRRNEARETLQTTLEGSMREDPIVLQWALSEAQQAGVAEEDPALVLAGERALDGLRGAESQSSAAQGPEEPAREAEEAEQRQAEEARQRELEEREQARREEEELRMRSLEELRAAARGGDPDRLLRAIEQARSAGVAKVAVRSAETYLTALRFVRQGVGKGQALRAWRTHITDLRSSRRALKEALHSGAAAEELEEAIDAASDAGVDEVTCDMARTVASHRRTAHDQAACALADGDLEELREAKAMNEAAGGPQADVAHLRHAIAEAEEDERMVHTWEPGLPDAVDRYFELLELEQREAQARVEKLIAAKKRRQEAEAERAANLARQEQEEATAARRKQEEEEEAERAAILARKKQEEADAEKAMASRKKQEQVPRRVPSRRRHACCAGEQEEEASAADLQAAEAPRRLHSSRRHACCAAEQQEDASTADLEAPRVPASAPSALGRGASRKQDEEWEREFSTMKARFERSRSWFALQEKQRERQKEEQRERQEEEQRERREEEQRERREEEQRGRREEERHALQQSHQQEHQASRSLPRRRKPLCGPGEDEDVEPSTAKSPVPASLPPTQRRTVSSPTLVPQSLPTRRRHVCGADGQEGPEPLTPRAYAPAQPRGAQGPEPPTAQAPAQPRATQPPAQATAPPSQQVAGLEAAAKRLQEDLAELRRTAEAQRSSPRRIGPAQMSPEDPLVGWQAAPMPQTMQPPVAKARPQQEDPLAGWMQAPTMPPTTMSAKTTAWPQQDPLAGWTQAPTMPQTTQSPKTTAWSQQEVPRNLLNRQRQLYGLEGDEEPAAARAQPTAAPQPVQASRNMPSRYKTSHGAAEAPQSRPVLLGQQQPPAQRPRGVPYSDGGGYPSARPGYTEPGGGGGAAPPGGGPGGPGGPALAPMVPGADAAAGGAYNYSSYEEVRGASTFHSMMANAAHIARKPEFQPRRHYEDPLFWRR